MVGASKIALSSIGMSNATRILDTTCVASSECPPSWKKLSSTLTSDRPSRSRQMAAIVSSSDVRGGTPACAAALDRAGAGRPLRSILPFGNRGSAASDTKTAES
jgi:hypothetical protein